jgi:Uma2 family endonuclease
MTSRYINFAQKNSELKFEGNTKGVLIIRFPVAGDSVNPKADLIIDLGWWSRHIKLGSTFSASTVFKLPNGAARPPDAAWIQRQRWEAMTPAERRKFPPIAPDFVIELRSATDALPMLQEKMQEYLNAGLRLAGLINPQQQQVEIDRLRQTRARRHLPTELSGEDVLPEFSLNLDRY